MTQGVGQLGGEQLQEFCISTASKLIPIVMMFPEHQLKNESLKKYLAGGEKSRLPRASLSM